MGNLLKRWWQQLALVGVASTLAVFVGAQPAQAGYVRFGQYDYAGDCEAAGQAGDGISWNGWYCEPSYTVPTYYQLYVWVYEA